MIHIELAPLRERDNDILLLADFFLNRLRPKNSPLKGFSVETLECFRRCRWPGNIRELRNVIERSVTLARGTEIEVSDLPQQLRTPSIHNHDVALLSEIFRDKALDNADRSYLTTVLMKHNGVIASEARQAGLSRHSLNKLLKRHGIEADDFR